MVLLAACGRDVSPQGRGEHAELGPLVTAPDPSVGCDMRVEKPWPGAAGFRIIADAVGVSCGEASLTIVIAGPRDQSHLAKAYRANTIPELFGGAAALAALDRAGMERALHGWIDATAATLNDSGDLPEWERRAPDARSGDRAFRPEMSRRSYEALRAEKRPLFCYDADENTLRCHALLADGTVLLAAVGRPLAAVRGTLSP